ncbi:16424_t:CDS:2, partial [Gigaspora margarita]
MLEVLIKATDRLYPNTILTDADSAMQNDNTIFIDNAFDYLLTHSFTLFKQTEDQVVEVWKVHLSISVKKAMKKKKAYAKTIGIASCSQVLEEYIVQNVHSLTASTFSLGQQSNLIEEYSKSNIIIKKPLVIVSNSIKKVRRACSPGTNTCSECGSKDHNCHSIPSTKIRV